MTAAPTVEVAGVRYPATLSTDEAAAWFGCSAERLQTLRGTGRLPVEPLQLGHRLRWPTALVAQAVGLPAAVIPGDVAGSLPEAPSAQVTRLPSGRGPDAAREVAAGGT